MLRGMLALAATQTFDVAEIAGGSPDGPDSAAGRAFDVDVVDGDPLLVLGDAGRRSMDGCRSAGATDVRVDGLRIHCGWPA